MATYIDALNGNRTDGSEYTDGAEEFSDKEQEIAYDKQLLIEAIADELCDAVDMKTLLQKYWDNQVLYMQDMDEEDLFEWNNTYLNLTPQQIESNYKLEE